MRPHLLKHPNIPKPLHGLAPRVVRGQAWWDQERRAAYKRAKGMCEACGVRFEEAKLHQRPEAHECYSFDYTTGRIEYLEAVALCHYCHMSIHDGKLLMDLRAGRISRELYDDILAHKIRILAIATESYPVTGAGAQWVDYHMVIDGVRYEQRFHSYEEWEEFYRE